jgi:hypothetical protein
MSFQLAFDELLSAWRSHEELRDSGAGFDQLITSRQRLEAARHSVHQARSV